MRIVYCVDYMKAPGGRIQSIEVSAEDLIDWMKNEGVHYFYVSVFRFERQDDKC